MAAVLDASLIIASVFNEGDNTVRAKRILTDLDAEQLLVPAIWHLETRNVVLVSFRRKRIGEAQFSSTLDTLARMKVETDPGLDPAALARTTDLARRHALTVYDASYLELALRRGARLASLDAAVVRAAAAEGVATL